MELRQGIEELIAAKVTSAAGEYFRAPLVGVADAKDPLFRTIREWAHPEHQLPEELLPGAQRVLVWFIPFAEWLVQENRRAKFVAESWAKGYIAANQLIADIGADVKVFLAANGYTAAYAAATHNFSEDTLVAPWSHRHLAYVAGLGEFGLNRMLITSAGCAGRFGSLVTACPLPPDQRQALQPCHGKDGQGCRDCLSLCPTKALKEDGSFDRQRCWQWVQAVDRYFPQLGTCDVCGKCCLGRCSVLSGEVSLDA